MEQMDPALIELYESGSKDDEVSVIIRLEPGAEPPSNVRVVSRFDRIVTARLPRGDIPRTHDDEAVASVKAGRAVFDPSPFEPDRSRDDAPPEAEGEEAEASEAIAEGPSLPSSRPVPEDGSGVVVGICDWGFDFTHSNFRTVNGATRFECLWDQRGQGDPLAPDPYRYGRLLSRAAIDAALATPDPFGTLGYHPAIADPTSSGAHGTHVLDILAGSRLEPGSQVGLASGADLVCVHLGSQRLRELENLGDSVALLEGLDFCRRQAAGRPCVLHLSAGKTAGEHRGDSPLERAVDFMLQRCPGIVLVQSVGNYAATGMHTHARLGPDQRHVLHWTIPPDDRTPNELEVWYSGEDVFGVTLTAPGGQAYAVELGDRIRIADGLVQWGNLYHRRREPNSRLNHIDAFLQPAAPAGEWRLELHGREVVDGRLHAWIERDVGSRYQSRFQRSEATSRYTTNTICNCYRAIAVGSHDARRPDRPPSRFSSRGPTADGRQKPEVSAPGDHILAARSTPRGGWNGERRLTVKSGTSMAAPWVSGTVALMFQAAGRPLTIHEIRRILIGTVDPAPGPKGRSSTRLGYGYLNVAAAVEAARRLRGEQPAAMAAAATLPSEGEEFGWAPVWVDLPPAEDAEEAAGEGGATSPPEEVEAANEGLAPEPPRADEGRMHGDDGERVEALDELELDERSDEAGDLEPSAVEFELEDLRDLDERGDLGAG